MHFNRLFWVATISLVIACGDDDGFLDAGVPDASRDASEDAAFDAQPGDAAADVDAGAPDVDTPDADPPDADASAPDAADPDGDTPDAAMSRIDALLARLRAPDFSESEGDTLLADADASHGWPLREGERLLFVTRQDATAVSWVADLNDFTPGTHPAEETASGVHWFALITVDPDTVLAGMKYKWHVDGGFFAPIESTFYGYDEFGEHGFVAPPADSDYFERFSMVLGGTRRVVRARVPMAVARDARLLFLADGQNVFGPDGPFGGWRVDAAIADTEILAVAVDNGPDRMDAYTHVADDPFGSGLVGGEADATLRGFFDELLPAVRSRFGVDATSAKTAFLGSSLGGLLSLYAALSRSSDLACVGAMSPTLGWGAFAADGGAALVNRFSERGPVAIYLDSGGGVTGACADGDDDGVFEDSDDRDNFCTTTQLRDHLASLGYTFGEDLVHWHEPGAGHNEAAWRARVPRFLAACEGAGWE